LNSEAEAKYRLDVGGLSDGVEAVSKDDKVDVTDSERTNGPSTLSSDVLTTDKLFTPHSHTQCFTNHHHLSFILIQASRNALSAYAPTYSKKYANLCSKTNVFRDFL